MKIACLKISAILLFQFIVYQHITNNDISKATLCSDEKTSLNGENSISFLFYNALSCNIKLSEQYNISKKKLNFNICKDVFLFISNDPTANNWWNLTFNFNHFLKKGKLFQV